MKKDYKTILLSNEPKIFGFPLLTVLPIVLLTLIGLLFQEAYKGMMIGFAISASIHFMGGDKSFRVLLSLIYHHSPKELNNLLFIGWPDSANKLYMR